MGERLHMLSHCFVSSALSDLLTKEPQINMLWKCDLEWLPLLPFFSFLLFLQFVFPLCKVNGAGESSSSRNRKSGESFIQNCSMWPCKSMKNLTHHYPLAVSSNIWCVFFYFHKSTWHGDCVGWKKFPTDYSHQYSYAISDFLFFLYLGVSLCL